MGARIPIVPDRATLRAGGRPRATERETVDPLSVVFRSIVGHGVVRASTIRGSKESGCTSVDGLERTSLNGRDTVTGAGTGVGFELIPIPGIARDLDIVVGLGNGRQESSGQ